MNDSHIVSIAQIKQFSKVDSAIKFKAVSKKELYQWINDVLTKFRYFSLEKKDKSIVKGYIIKMTGLSQSQLGKITAKKKKFGKVLCDSTARHKFDKIYSPSDVARLVETDNAHQRLSGPATKATMQREYSMFGRSEYKTIQNISVSHLYNLRETRQYKSHSLTVKKTIPVKNSIGVRIKPEPNGIPGFLRVDTVHQGDLDKVKGIYHINIVDEVLQWEIVGAVPKISEYYLGPLLLDLLEQLPFVVINFHSDNGSEYVNRLVAELLNKLSVQQTKSRARHCNDNGLVECKNGAVVRKHMGHVHIPQTFAQSVNQFYKQHFNPYLNFHRSCAFATITIDKKGKQRKIYKQENYAVPYEKLKSLKDAGQHLKQGISFRELDKIAYAMSDNQFALEMQKAKKELFKNFKHLPQEMISFTNFISRSYVD